MNILLQKTEKVSNYHMSAQILFHKNSQISQKCLTNIIHKIIYQRIHEDLFLIFIYKSLQRIYQKKSKETLVYRNLVLYIIIIKCAKKPLCKVCRTVYP